MRNTIKTVLAGGSVAIATIGGGAMYLQHELHYLLRPSVIETVAGVVAVGGGVLWAAKVAKGKAKAEQDEQIVESWSPPPMQALPRPVPTQHFLSEGVVEQRLTQLAKSLQKS